MLVAEQIEFARRHAAAGDWRLAAQLAESALTIAPNDTVALHIAGAAQFHLKDFIQAVRQLERAAAIAPADGEICHHLGVVYVGLGERDLAQRCFERAIQIAPDSADALYNLALFYAELGRPNAAIGLYRRAVCNRPTYAEAWFNLGNSLRELGQLDEAISAYRQALALRPTYPKALNNVGTTYMRRKEYDAAIRCFSQALEFQPDNRRAHFNLGTALRAIGRASEAIVSFQAAMQSATEHDADAAIRPRAGKTATNGSESDRRTQLGLVAAQLQLGNEKRAAGHIEDALRCYEQAVALADDNVPAWNNLGSCHFAMRRYADAEACFQKVLSLNPCNAKAINNLAAIQMAGGQLDQARNGFEHALAMEPNYAEAHGNLGAVLQDLGHFSESEACYERAIELDPDFADAHWNRALLWLRQGDYDRGWPEYEWRWRRVDFCGAQFRTPPASNGRRPANQKPRGAPTDAPLWDGSPLAGRRVLVFAEQGLGDTIQFIRFARLVKEAGGVVVLECQRALAGLLRTCQFVDEVIAQGEPLPAHDLQVPLMSLPAVAADSRNIIATAGPYLCADLDLRRQWAPKLKELGGLNIGIHWQGNPAYNLDWRRSIPLHEFRPLAKVPCVQLISLQFGFGAEQLADAQRVFPITVLDGDIDGAAGPFMDTEAILAELDLVITSDSAMAHLAGALGVRTWLLLPHVADWRWLIDREDSPWYPTMRIFRQCAPGNWDELFRRIAASLRSDLA